MSALTDALDRILCWLEDHEDLDFARFESLQPGLTYEEIEEKVIDLLPFHLPKEVYELYQWGNGAWVGEKYWARFFEDYVFLSLESALVKYCDLTAINKEDDSCVIIIKSNWNLQWFPIFEDINGRGYYVVVINEVQNETTPILQISFEEIYDPYIIYPTLTKMMLAETECYEAGIYSNKSYGEGQDIRSKYQEIPLRIWRVEQTDF
ncbi:SMI1/KNR4 family protein [Nostocaceae cyanobacterium CENA369]|uniref:SMI1/KNR4 family protein n=1 Tax=Dendronalium phyllosphericum CENA369 TaxID=1725256 RepID=A0A8J7IBE6_9NOST|nr:SMI1/KNR4 family protein [Dendronalium phyllosphericum]MBH8577735.1 SMI1/KNR4 family protein [Dendronalium phyllosphericum CENA369]